MIHLIAQPVGIDVAIRQLQEAMFTKLKAKWELIDEQYDCYARCYRNQKADGYVPELYVTGKDYEDRFGNDKVPVESFFGIAGREQLEGNTVKQDVHIIFKVDLSVVKPNLTHRGDEEARRDVFNALRSARFGFTYREMVTGMYEVFKEYDSRLRDSIKYGDLHPIHYFRANLSLTTNPNACLRTNN